MKVGDKVRVRGIPAPTMVIVLAYTQSTARGPLDWELAPWFRTTWFDDDGQNYNGNFPEAALEKVDGP